MEPITNGPAAGDQLRAASVAHEFTTSTSVTEAPQRRLAEGRIRSLLGVARSGDFSRFWAAQAISALGTQVSAVAMPLLAALSLAASPMSVGVLTAAAGLPHLLFGLFAGAWVDRLQRRPIMIAADIGRAALLMTIPLAAWLGELRIELLILVAFLDGTLRVFFDIAYLAYLPALTPRSLLVEANSKLEATSSGAQVIGPALGGLLVRLLGAPIAMIVDALTFLVSAAFLLGIRVKEQAPAPVADSSLLREMAQGLAVVWRDRTLRALALASGVMNFGAMVFFAVYVLYLTRTLALGPGAVGLVFALGGAGALLGSLAAGRVRARWGVGATLVGSLVLFGAFGLAIPLAVFFPERALPLILVSEFMQWAMVLIFDINAVSLRQAITPDRLLGRVNGTMRFVVWGVRPAGSLLGGYLGGLAGLPVTLAIGGAIMLVAFLPLLSSPIPRLRTWQSASEVAS